MPKTPNTIVRCTMTGITTVYADGLEVDDSIKTTDEYHGGSEDRLSETHQDRTVKWKLTGVRDHMSLNLLVYKCRQGYTFTITEFGKDEKGVWRPLERLDECSTLDRKRKFGDKKAVSLDVQGTAQNAEPLAASYD